MHIVRLECQASNIKQLQMAVDEHMKRLKVGGVPRRAGELATFGTVAMLQIAEPGQLMKRGLAEDTRTIVAASALYRELQLGHRTTLLAARLGEHALEHYSRDYQGVRGYELPARAIGDEAVGVAILYDDPENLDAVFDRMHELRGLMPPDAAAERRAELRERIVGVVDLTELVRPPEPERQLVHYSKSA